MSVHELPLPTPVVAPTPPLFPVERPMIVGASTVIDECLIAAGLLWSAHSTWPTVRAIAAVRDRTASSVLAPFGTVEHLRAVLIRAERKALADLVASGLSVAEAAAARVEQLESARPGLSRLPLVAALADGVTDPLELAALAGAVRPHPAAA